MIEQEKRIERYRRLMELSRDLASTLDLDMLLDRITQAARDITESEAASILLYDNTAKELYFQIATNMDQPMMRGLVVPLEGSIAGWIVTHREPVRIQDVQHDTRYFKKIAKTTSLETRSLMGTPLITKDKVVGVLEVINKSEGDFTDTDEDLLSVLGAQAAVAIENTRLFQQSDLIAEFVHELRTPLASVSTATYLLLRPEISREQSEQIIKNIYDETMRLNTLASSFLDLARLESGRVQFQKSTFPIADVLEECSGVMQGKAVEYSVTIETIIEPGIAVMNGDRGKLKQVFLNLLSNAIKYNRPGGKVVMRVSQDEKNWQVSFSDNGMGIPEDAMPRLFEKFFRVKGSENKAVGTGLGLSICKGIIQGHGGKIDVKSEIGRGTIFTVYIPK